MADLVRSRVADRRREEAHPMVTMWVIDVPELDRAVEVPVSGDRSPSVRDLLAVLGPEERAVVEAAEARRRQEQVAEPLQPVPEHVCDRGGCGCCPGCGDGCGHCEPFPPCAADPQCVMPNGHQGPCVPTDPSREHLETEARRLRAAGIRYEAVETAGRLRLRYELDPMVPTSGRYRRRLTVFNRREMIEWLGGGAHEPEDPGSDVVVVDSPEGRVVILLGDIVERTPDGRFRVVPRATQPAGPVDPTQLNAYIAEHHLGPITEFDVLTGGSGGPAIVLGVDPDCPSKAAVLTRWFNHLAGPDWVVHRHPSDSQRVRLNIRGLIHEVVPIVAYAVFDEDRDAEQHSVLATVHAGEVELEIHDLLAVLATMEPDEPGPPAALASELAGDRGVWYPAPPPYLPGESDDDYSSRLTGAAGLHRVPYNHFRLRECALGHHGSCPDEDGRRCKCPHHTEDGTQRVAPAQASTILARLYGLPVETGYRVTALAQAAVFGGGATTKAGLAARIGADYGSTVTDAFVVDVINVMRDMGSAPAATPPDIAAVWTALLDSAPAPGTPPPPTATVDEVEHTELEDCPACAVPPGTPHADRCDHAHCPDCGEQLLRCEHHPDRSSLWHGVDQKAEVARANDWWTTEAGIDHPVEDYEAVIVAITRGMYRWDPHEQRYQRAATLGAENLPPATLRAVLRAGVAGRLTDEAAVQLLIDARSVLSRMDFARYIDYSEDPAQTGGPAMAWVRWDEVIGAMDRGELRLHGAQEPVVRIAASLGAGLLVDLRGCVTNSLGREHGHAVVNAIAHAAGQQP